MKRLKLFFACLLMAVLSIGQVWAVDPVTVKSTFSKATTPSDNQVTDLESAVTWDISTDGAVGSPSYTVGSADSKEGLKFGASKSAYYGKIDLSTDYFKNYNVKSVKLYVKNNGSKIGTLTAKQGSVTIGTQSNTSATNAWNEMTASGTTGEGGILTVSYEVAQASYINYIEVTYEVPVSTDCESKITITKAANPANGTFEIDNSGEVCIDEGNATVNVTATPADHYHLATVTSTVGTIGSIAGNTCEITDIDADTEIGVTFAEDTKYVVTWNVNGNEDTKTNVYAGEKPVFPATPAACDATSTTFIGWATAPWTGKLADLSEKTVYTSASAMPDVDAAVTYYAVFAKVSGTPSVTHTLTISGKTAASGYASRSETDDKEATWSGVYNYGDETHIGLNKKSDNHYLGSPLFDANVTSVKATIKNGSSSARSAYLRSENETAQPSSGDLGSVSVPANDEQELTFTLGETAFKQFYVYVSDPLQFHEFIVTLEGSATYSDYMTTCCTKYNVNIAAGITNGSVSADPASACEGATITLTFTPATNYHLSAWTLNGEAQDVNANTFSMPAGAATISATFDQDACDPLATPVVTVSGKAYPYDAVKLAWSAITNADSYKVYIYDAEDNELEHNDAVTGVEYTIGQTLSASTTYKYSVQAISNTPATYCPSVAAAGTFETDALPTAHLTLIDLEGEHASSGDYAILTPFNLPTTAASCSKAFYGWTATNGYSSENEAPEYVKGAEFTFANTTGVTLYAVYADETPGAATLTKLGSGATFADGDKLVIAAKGTNFGLYFENAGSAYVKNWEFEGEDPVLSELTDSKKILTLVKSGDNWKFGDATNGYFYSSSSNNLEISTTNSSEFNSFSWNTTESAFTITKTDGRYLNCRTDLTSTNANLWRFNGTNTNAGSPFLNVYKYAAGASTYDNYSTECLENAETPTITPDGSADYYTTAQNVIITAEEDATIYYTMDGTTPTTTSTQYTEAISLSERGEYTIKAIAVKTGKANSDVAEAVIKINLPFANLAELVEANIASGSEVIVSFADEVITDDQYISQGTKRAGLMLTTKAANNKAIEIFYNKGTTVVPAAWVIGGKLSATAMTFTWTFFSDQWELVPLGNDWTWDNGDLTYTAPKAVSSVVVSGSPAKTSYVDGEKFAPAGLTVTVNYTEGEPEVNPTGVTFACTPERVTKETTSVNVVATFNEVPSDAFEVTGLTVGDIQLKTIAQFIADKGGRCYLEGIVSGNINTTYGNFDLQDETGTIYVYGSDVFEDHGVAQGDKVKVIAEEYLLYKKAGNPDKDEALNVVFVSKKSPATMTFNDLALEFGEEETMVPASITLADASDVIYSIKDGSDDCVTIADDQITAKSVAGTATIVATLAEADDYVGTTVEFTVTVTAPITKYAITFDGNGADGGNAPEAIADQAENAEVTLPANTYTLTGNKFDGWKVINNTTSAEVPVAAGKFSMPASAVTIQAQWAPISAWAYVYDNNVKTAYTNSGAIGTITISDKAYRLVKAGSKNNTGTIKVTVPAGATDLHFHAFAWGGQTATVEISGVTNPSVSEFALAGETGAAGSGNDFTLQGVPVDQYFHVSFDAVAEETEIVFSKATSSADNRFFLYGVNQEGGNFGSYERTGLAAGNYATICLPNGGTIAGAKLYDLEYYDGSNTLYLLEVNGNAMVAGRPYIFLPSETSIEVTYTNNFNASAGSFNGLVGSYSQVEITKNAGNYILYQNQYWLVNSEAYVGANRAYIHMADVPDAPSQQQSARRRVAMTVNGANAPQGFDNLESGDAPKKVMIEGTLYIIRGEKQYDATGRLVK